RARRLVVGVGVNRHQRQRRGHTASLSRRRVGAPSRRKCERPRRGKGGGARSRPAVDTCADAARGGATDSRLDQASGVWRMASTSRDTWILSPITTPPPSRGMLVSIPKSLRLSSVVAEKPALVPP